MDKPTKSSEVKRIAVSNDVLVLLANEVSRFRQFGEQYKVNESKLVSAIIERYFDRYINKDRTWLEKKFFDKRTYLRSLIDNSASDEALASSIKEFVKKSKSKKTASKENIEVSNKPEPS